MASKRLHFALQMEDLGTGEYAGSFSATAAGAYSVSVTFQGSHIAGSPFAAEARPLVHCCSTLLCCCSRMQVGWCGITDGAWLSGLLDNAVRKGESLQTKSRGEELTCKCRMVVLKVYAQKTCSITI